MQDGGTDRAPDRSWFREVSTEPNQLGHPLRRTGLNSSRWPPFLQQRGCSCFIHITWSVVIGLIVPPIPLRVYGLPRQTWLFLATCKVSGQMSCLIGKEISGRFLHGATTYRCRYEEVVHANSLPETARLKVEGLYVIPHLCVEQPQLVSI